MGIAENYQRVRKEISDDVTIVVAAKTRNAIELATLIDAGATDIGENYVQEATVVYNQLGEKAKKVRWHMIGALQKNKINKVLPIFDVIQTVDSLKLAEAIDKRSDRMVPVYIEINSGKEPQKSGIMPEEAEETIRRISHLKNLKIEGVMTMGPRFGNPEDARPYFRETRKIFEYIRSLDILNLDMNVLSMGMSNSYKIAIEEGSNMVRIGTAIFGERKYDK